MMMDSNYPALGAHQNEHAYFVQKLLDFSDDFRAKKGDLELEVLVFLREWFSDHILRTEAKFVSYLQKVTQV